MLALFGRSMGAAAFILALSFAGAGQAQAPAPTPVSPAPAPANAGNLSGTLQSQSFDHATLTLQIDHGGPAVLAVLNLPDRDKLADAQPGDRVTVTVNDLSAPKTVTSVQRVTRPIPPLERIMVFALAALLLVGLAAVATGFRPLRFVVGSDGRYSKSQFQLAMWFGVVATVYLAATWLRVWHFGLDYVGGIGVTTNVLAMTGLSAFTFGSAKLVATQKADSAGPLAPVAPAVAPGVDATPAATDTAAPANPPSRGVQRLIQELVDDNQNTPDFGDFQMLLITFAAVAIFGLSAYGRFGELELLKSITLPDVDTALLGAFGLGHGAYLYKKAVTPGG